MGALSIDLFVLVAAAPQWSHAAGWQYPIGDSANTGFVKQVTAPAEKPTRLVQVGDVADGAGPVVGPGGTVNIGNLEGPGAADVVVEPAPRVARVAPVRMEGRRELFDEAGDGHVVELPEAIAALGGPHHILRLNSRRV